MIKKFLKAAGVKTKEEFYKKYPNEAAFFKAHPEMKKFKQGGQQKKLNQLTNFTTDVDQLIPNAQMGTYIGGDVTEQPNEFNFYDTFNELNYGLTGEKPLTETATEETAKKGKKIPKYQFAPTPIQPNPGAQPGWQNTMWGQTPSITGQMPTAPTNPNAPQTFTINTNQQAQSLGLNNSPLGSIATPTTAPTSGAAAASGFPLMGLAQGVGGIFSAAQQIKQEKEQMKRAKMFKNISGVVAQAAATRPEKTKRKYVRPEDQIINPNELSPTYGTGTNFLQAQDGAEVVTGSVYDGDGEIQNTYDPNTLYADLGYTPLDDSTMKQYRTGGVRKAGFGDILGGADAGQLGSIFSGIGSSVGGGGFTQTGGGMLGSSIGSTVGSLVPIPGASQVLGAVGGLIGGIFGGQTAKKTKKYQEEANKNLMNAAWQSGAQNLQNTYSSFMKDGGWISHNWQPQLITHFGELSTDEVKRFAADGMDTLRTGGSLRQNYMQPTDAMDGDVVTRWGGYAEPISYNPFLPDGGETVMFRGQSHDESDRKGRTGIGVSYGGSNDSYTDYAEYGTDAAANMADVEVERNEPAVKLPDVKSGENSLVVFGNLKIPSHFLSEIGDLGAKGKKFKTYVKELSKKEEKQNKLIDKSVEQASEIDTFTPFDKLKISALHANILGATMKLKDFAQKKKNAAAVQNAINDTAEEYGLVADDLAKGKVKKEKARYGKSIPVGQAGVSIVDYLKEIGEDSSFANRKKLAQENDIPNYKGLADQNTDLLNKIKAKQTPAPTIKFTPVIDPITGLPVDEMLPAEDQPVASDSSTIPPSSKEEKRKKKGSTNWMDVVNAALPYLRPSNVQPLDPTQLAGEMFALSTNQLEPVQAQQYFPQLQQSYQISLQDQLNEITAQTRAAQRLAGPNPAAQAIIGAQDSANKMKVLAEQMRANQGEMARVYGQNIETLNKARLANLQILDTQYARQAEAKSKTKATALEALKSISDKIAKNKLENRTLSIYENLYNYRFDPRGRAINLNPLAKFNISDVSDVIPVFDKDGNLVEYRKKDEEKTSKKTSRNGSIVRQLKNS